MRPELRRGQTLLLFALMSLVMVLMVCMTLAIGSRTKERMELQTLADAAAYSQAVATARSFNAISVMNRVQVAHAVSTLGTLSLISWSTLYAKHAQNAAKLFTLMTIPYAVNAIINCIPPPKQPACSACRAGLAQGLINALLARRHARKTRSKLRQDVELFERETLPRWNAAVAIHAAQLQLLERTRKASSESGLGKSILAAAQVVAPTELSAVASGGEVTARELGEAITDFKDPVDDPSQHHLGQMVMASRGHKFIRHRTHTGDWGGWIRDLAWRSRTLFAGGAIDATSATGQGYYSETWTTSPSGRPVEALAHDAGGRTRTGYVRASKWFKHGGKCPSPLPAYPISAAIGLIGRGVPMGSASVGPDRHQALGHDVTHAMRTFPPFVDFNAGQLDDADNLYGQPKTVALLARDYDARRDPWELAVRFKDDSAAADDFDLNKPQSYGARGAPSRQLALGTGVVYYHRYQFPDEPPNLFAPFWRAGLSRYTVDRPTLGTPREIVQRYDAEAGQLFTGEGVEHAADAYEALLREGYKGFQ